MAENVFSLAELGARLIKTGENMDKAGNVALTRTGVLSIKKVEEKIAQVFDRPAPKSQKPLRLIIATFEKPYADIVWKDVGKTNAGKWFQAEVEGGQRNRKASEKALERGGEGLGILGGAYRYLVPTHAAPLDQYGNMPGSLMSKIIADVVGATSSGYTAKTGSGLQGASRHKGKLKVVRYMAGRTKNGQPAIYDVKALGNSGILPIMVGVTRAQYRKRLPLTETISDTYDKNFKDLYDKALIEFL